MAGSLGFVRTDRYQRLANRGPICGADGSTPAMRGVGRLSDVSRQGDGTAARRIATVRPRLPAGRNPVRLYASQIRCRYHSPVRSDLARDALSAGGVEEGNGLIQLTEVMVKS